MSSKEQEATKSLRRRMQKRVETKEDGRLLIYYTFERAESETVKEQAAKAVSK